MFVFIQHHKRNEKGCVFFSLLRILYQKSLKKKNHQRVNQSKIYEYLVSALFAYKRKQKGTMLEKKMTKNCVFLYERERGSGGNGAEPISLFFILSPTLVYNIETNKLSSSLKLYC